MELESLRLDDEIGALLTCSSSGILSHEDQSTLIQPRLKKRRCWTTTYSLGNSRVELSGYCMETQT